MPLPINIEDLLQQKKVERTRIEYKSDWNPEPIVHTITAFANDFDNMGGGYIIIGVEEENGRPKFPLKGLNKDSIDRVQSDILNKCNFIEPRYIPIIEPYTIDGKELLVLWIPGGENRPYKCPEKIYTQKGGEKSSKAYYIRKGSQTIKANIFEERELVSLARDIPFDDRINYLANISDLKLSLISNYLQAVGSDLYKDMSNRTLEEIAIDMQLLRGPSEYLKPLNVSLMFFNDKPEKFFPYTQIEVVEKPNPTGIGMIEHIFKGPLDQQLSSALSYIKNNFIKEYITKVPDNEKAVRVFNWPFQAIEEALCNAVYHRSYQINEPITVTITPEKIEILSIPGADRSITDEQIQKGIFISKRYRNRRLGDFLKELSLVEGRNTGIPLILSAMSKNGSDRPIFETDKDRTYFLVTLPINYYFLKQQGSLTQNAQLQKNNSSKSTRRSRDEIEILIKQYLSEHGNMSTNEIALALGYKTLSNTIRSVVNNLIQRGEVKYLYPDKPNSKNQKICLVK